MPKELCQTVFLNPKTVKVYCLFVLFKFKEFISFQVVDLVKYCKNADEDEVNERLNLINDLSPDDRRTLEKLVKEEKEKRTPRRRTPRLSNRARLLSG